MTASREWSSRPEDQRFQTLEALAAAVEARRAHSTAENIDVKDMNFTADAENIILTLGEGGTPNSPTNWKVTLPLPALLLPG